MKKNIEKGIEKNIEEEKPKSGGILDELLVMRNSFYCDISEEQRRGNL